MDPYKRWDDWEWEKAIQELSQKRERKYSPHRKRSYGRNFFDYWNGSQKRTLLAAILFLTVFFSSHGDDPISKGVYSVYQKTNGTDYFAYLTDMAKEAVGLGGAGIEGIPVDAGMKGKFLPPVSGPVEAGFGVKDEEGKTHEGIDVGSSLGTKVVAPYKGIVVDVFEDPRLGRAVKLDFGDGWTGILGNLGNISVEKGERVEMGQVIGTVGLSAPVKKPWLHIELRKNNKAVNPIPYFISNS